MKQLLIAGVILMILGAAALAYRGFTTTKQEKVLDIGPIQATAEKTEHHSIPPLVGWALLGGGVILAAGSAMASKKA